MESKALVLYRPHNHVQMSNEVSLIERERRHLEDVRNFLDLQRQYQRDYERRLDELIANDRRRHEEHVALQQRLREEHDMAQRRREERYNEIIDASIAFQKEAGECLKQWFDRTGKLVEREAALQRKEVRIFNTVLFATVLSIYPA